MILAIVTYPYNPDLVFFFCSNIHGDGADIYTMCCALTVYDLILSI